MPPKSKCLECKGRGEIPCPVEYSDEDHPESCAVCGGDSRVRVTCPDCDGTGKSSS